MTFVTRIRLSRNMPSRQYDRDTNFPVHWGSRIALDRDEPINRVGSGPQLFGQAEIITATVGERPHLRYHSNQSHASDRLSFRQSRLATSLCEVLACRFIAESLR